MKIAIIGAGKVGASIATGLARKGHTIILGTRDPGKADIKALMAKLGASAMPQREAAANADVTVLSLPWGAAEGAIKALGDLKGKTVIDCMNPLGMVGGALGLTTGFTTSAGEMVQAWLPGAHLVKTLNQVGAELMANNSRLAGRPVMFMAGNDDGAKRAVVSLLTALGFEPQDAGDLSKARILEPYAMVWINQALLRGAGRDWAFGMVRTKG